MLKASSARTLAAALVVVAVTGCGGASPRTAARRSPSASPGSAPGAGQTEATREPGSSPRASPGRSPAATSSPRPIPEDPAPAVSSMLRAIDEDDYATQRASTMESAQVLLTVRDVIHQENERRGATTDNRVTIVQPPAVIEAGEAEARVSVVADIHATVSGDKGTFSSDDRIEGPILLKKFRGHWRVSDLVYSGRPLAPTYFPLDVRQTREGLTLVVEAVLSYKTTTAVVVRFLKEESGGLNIAVGNAKLTAEDGSTRDQNQLAFESTGNPFGFVGFPRADGKPKAIGMDVRATDGDDRWRFDVTL